MKKLLTLLLGGVLACIFIFLLFFIIKFSFPNIIYPKNAQNTNSTTTSAPLYRENCTQFPLADGCGIVGVSINICSSQHSSYPPLSNILTTPDDPYIGVYEGKITNVNVHLHAITVTSDRSGNSFLFTGGSVNGKIYDIHNTLINNFYSLKPGPKAFISFNCSQRNGFFILTRFQLAQ